jgi:hypothetical protein
MSVFIRSGKGHENVARAQLPPVARAASGTKIRRANTSHFLAKQGAK